MNQDAIELSKNIGEKKLAHLIVVGFDDIVGNKYLPCIEEAIDLGFIDSYSVIDLESQKVEIDNKIASLKLKPEKVYYLPDSKKKDAWADPDIFGPIFEKLKKQKGIIKVYIATELKAHEGYLKYCIENEIDSLVEKPILAPMQNGQFDPTLIESTMHYLISETKKRSAKHSVMTLSRYHKIYNDIVLNSLGQKMVELGAPLTSFHFRHAGGVWNLHREYESREDHPYKYGYGMIMHGGYHYIDLTVQFLRLNKLIFPDATFSLTMSSYVAYPTDQNDRIPKKFSENFDDNYPNWSSVELNPEKYGETDIVTSFCLKNKDTGKVLTVGTISLEQTTPSIRTWKDIPPDMYNKNGRISKIEFEAQLSTLHSVDVQCFDVPISGNKGVDRIDAFARISTRTNASLLQGEEYNTEQTHNGLFHSDSNRQLMSMWLKNEENKSQLFQHVPVMRTIQALATSIQKPGHPITFDFI
ncbi:hypothetical protein A2443_00465 [Candidatus Nomurabacteria bacterium RIFOXYC2_FULL_43_16]|uniref:Gfo/Idh/MocA-like oxidoreductase N-terminal domain-containing protein n=2 Tax=Candidatus Nomuraibacteriota TaxID=1752729 RepID=A0A0G1ELL0_9BACT|nr:hypothetical protein [uncultured bacterium]KKR00190.1 MAG: hypothetical protein UT27_C0021G0004 [Candidatus Nomurabacteria bacterium GW2011_GWD2_39_12]KKS48836.1 MAG: hypothetical protein UV13_C0011G0030 [Parcubacteria group bacterium GW2011_GWC1_42_21]KKS58317.1 MAG: hypothetical protein UV23_C0011G0004 [Candidatus Nomurabacteria bacterium GW2011_GWF1_42_40]KKS99611.1 MAG: hypothetical protein UV77_C0011G0017 [Candidatus Nomurabacteria bacterium GW2011_GWA1_43_17]KKT10668.1 MAG: hypothetic